MNKTANKIMAFLYASCVGIDFISMINNIKSNDALFAVIDALLMVWVSLSAVYYLKDL